ncbi:DUF4810 domain-containing protein [Flavicella sediminum]|uniref:DUF4810 domain-containing protein n=1 Tax=Flavicella sediminum TaxID=2585141 RepID=UPI001120D11E|nr:DUF4810 domain-containing protein [Flavicella sediminum]
MKKSMGLIVVAFMFASCGAKTPLYYWSTYERDSYNYLKNNDQESIDKLGLTYQKIIDNHKKGKSIRKEVPPGVYADYGFLLIKNNKVKEGKELLAIEIAMYPESKIFVERILKMIE